MTDKEFKKKLLVAWISRGLSARRACKQAGISEMTYYRWLKKDQQLKIDIKQAKTDYVSLVERRLFEIIERQIGTKNEIRLIPHLIKILTLKSTDYHDCVQQKPDFSTGVAREIGELKQAMIKEKIKKSIKRDICKTCQPKVEELANPAV